MPPTRKSPASYPSPQRKTGLHSREVSASATKDAILRAATKVFATYGIAGGTVERISKAAKSHDRMIYYYFGSKEALYTAVLEDQYRQFNNAEAAVEISLDSPRHALDEIVRFVWGYYQKHPEFIRLLNDENLHKAVHIAKSKNAQDCSIPAVGLLTKVLRAGIEKGMFRSSAVAQKIYITIAALGYFYLSNRFTLSATLGTDLTSSAAKDEWESYVLDAVYRIVRND